MMTRVEREYSKAFDVALADYERALRAIDPEAREVPRLRCPRWRALSSACRPGALRGPAAGSRHSIERHTMRIGETEIMGSLATIATAVRALVMQHPSRVWTLAEAAAEIPCDWTDLLVIVDLLTRDRELAWRGGIAQRMPSGMNPYGYDCDESARFSRRTAADTGVYGTPDLDAAIVL